MVFSASLDAKAQSFNRNGNNFEQVSTTKSSSATKTKFTWTDSKGNTYPIYIGSTGSCYVLKVSQKTNKEYKYYLGAEISQAVCKELGIKYKNK